VVAERWEAGPRQAVTAIGSGLIVLYDVARSAEGLAHPFKVDVVSTCARPVSRELAPQDLRRTFAKLPRSGLAPLEHIQLALGHQNVQTVQRYLGWELHLSDAACERLRIRIAT